jgi:hypothetical protein
MMMARSMFCRLCRILFHFFSFLEGHQLPCNVLDGTLPVLLFSGNINCIDCHLILKIHVFFVVS